MRQSKKAHPVAVLRTEIGLHQQEFADLVGIKIDALQSIEIGRLKLSEQYAEQISRQTGSSIKWLMNADPSAPPINEWGKPYTKGYFETKQSWINRKLGKDHSDLAWTQIMVAGTIGQFCGITASALKNDRFILFNYKLARLLNDLEKEFGADLRHSVIHGETSDLATALDPVIRKLNLTIQETLTSAKSKTTSKRRPR